LEEKMQTTQAHTIHPTLTETDYSDANFSADFCDTEASALEVAMELLDMDFATEADAVLTAELLQVPHDEHLWLAAGICRLRRGAIRSAAAAFEMVTWMTGDPTAQELLKACRQPVI
jgi:hypothetical protein